jgi:hypothetical protein
MKAYLIDPFEHQVTEVEYSGDFRDIYKLIDAQCFDCARFNERGDAVYVDDEGLLGLRPMAYFAVDGYLNILAGKGLVLGCDRNGESTSPTISLEEMKSMTHWILPVVPGFNLEIHK